MAWTTWISNIFSGLASINITSYAGSVRLLQVLLSIVLIGLSGSLVTNNNSSLTSFAEEIDSMLGDSDFASALFNITGSTSNSSSIALQSLKGTSVISLATSAFTSLSHTSMSLLPYAFDRDGNSMVSSTSLSDISGGIFSTLSSSELVYTSSLSGSEIASFVLWGATAIYSTAKYGNWNCTDPTKLLEQYNQSSVDTDSLSLFNEILSYDGDSLESNDGADNTTLALINAWDDVYQIFNSTINISGANLTSVTAKQALFVKLSQDCTMKKSAIAVSWLGVLTFVFSGTLVVVSANRLSNGSTSNSSSTTTTTTTTAIKTARLSTEEVKDTKTPTRTMVLLSVKADTSNWIPEDTDRQTVCRDNDDLFICNISTSKSDSQYVCNFQLRMDGLDEAIDTTIKFDSAVEPAQCVAQAKVVDNLSYETSISGSFDIGINEIIAVYSNTRDKKSRSFRQLKRVVVYLTMDSHRVRVSYEVRPSEYRQSAHFAGSAADLEAQDEGKFKVVYSRAILFPKAIVVG